jgi:hypothetical protein
MTNILMQISQSDRVEVEVMKLKLRGFNTLKNIMVEMIIILTKTWTKQMKWLKITTFLQILKAMNLRDQWQQIVSLVLLLPCNRRTLIKQWVNLNKKLMRITLNLKIQLRWLISSLIRVFTMISLEKMLFSNQIWLVFNRL